MLTYINKKAVLSVLYYLCRQNYFIDMKAIKLYFLFFLCMCPFLVSAQHVTYRSFDHYNDRVAEFETMRAIDSTDVVMLGNSLTEYAGDWNVLLKARHIRNRGIAGDDAEGIYNRLIQILPGKPKAIFLLVGGNDLSHDLTPSQVFANCKKVIEKILADSPKTKLYVCLGSTEMIAGATITYDSSYIPDSVGIPMVRVNCKIADLQSGDELSYFEEGEICFSGETMMLGYYNNSEATDEIVRTDEHGTRWLHTGDLGYMDENGALYVTGRIKRIHMTKGNDGNITKIFPDRIEKAVYMHPAVDLCCVVGVPDQMRINYPKAFVVLKDKGLDNNNITEEIRQICRENLPDYMVPDEIEYRDDLPRTPRGKIDYRALEEMAKEK